MSYSLRCDARKESVGAVGCPAYINTPHCDMAVPVDPVKHSLKRMHLISLPRGKVKKFESENAHTEL
jgi:hypothetical protein